MIGPDERLRRGAERILGTPISARQAQAFSAYLDLLQAWNRVHRLVGSSDRAWMVDNLILDSLLFLRVLPASFDSVLDIGSGAGIPGIPIGIMHPAATLVLAESRRKRASFLAAAVRSTGLTGARVFNGRAEVLVGDGMAFDAVVARCAGSAGSILELGSLLVSPRGMVVVAGAPEGLGMPKAELVRVVNPDTGALRTFLVRRGSGS